MDKQLKIKISIDKNTGALKVVKDELDNVSSGVRGANSATKELTQTLKDVAKGAVGLYAIKQALDITKDIANTGMALESLTMSLEAAVGSATKADKELKYLSKTTERLGLSFKASIDGFTQLSASAKETSLEGANVEKIFTGVSEAAAVMGLSVDDQNGVFRALSQMMSKGKIQAEELRGQLGERLPGAFQIAARAMGMSTQELDKFMSSGKLLSEDFLPKFAEQLTKEFGKKVPLASKTALAEQNRFNNSLLKMKVAIYDSGLEKLTKDFYKMGAEATNAFTAILNGTSKYQLEADFTIATISRTIDIFNVFFEVIENGAQNAVLGISSLVYGTLAPITHMLSVTTKGLNAIGLSSDENLKSALKLEIATYTLAENAQKRIKSNTKEITDALYKANTPIEERVLLYQKEREELRKNLALKKEPIKTNTPKKKGFDYDSLPSLNIKNDNDLVDTAVANAYELIKTKQEKVNEEYLKTYELMKDTFKTDEMDRFFQKWNEDYNQTVKAPEPPKPPKPIELDTTAFDSIDNLIDKQLESIEINNTWAGSFDGVTAGINNVLNAFVNSHKTQLNLDKKKNKLQETYAKKYIKIENSTLKPIEKKQKLTKLGDDFDADSSKLKEQRQHAEIAGYADLAGAMGSAFEQGTAGALAFQTVQATLGIVNSWSAIANAWALPFPANIPAVAMVASQVMPIIGQLSSMGGSGGGSGGSSVGGVNSSTIATSQNQSMMTEKTEQPILDRLDRQIELLEMLGKSGTADTYKLELAKKQYSMDIKLKSEEIIRNAQSSTSMEHWNNQKDQDQLNKAWLEQFSKVNEELTTLNDGVETTLYKANYDYKGNVKSVDFQDDTFRDDPLTALSAVYKYGLDPTLSNSQAAQKEGAKGHDQILAWEIGDAAEKTGAIQQVTADYIKSLNDVVESLKDAKDDFIDIYDQLNEQDTYSSKKFKDARDRVTQLAGDGSEESYSNYIKASIENINAVEAEYGDLNTLFLSQDVEDLKKQGKALNELNADIAEVYEEGGEKALNYKDDLTLVGEAFITSKENIAKWTQRDETTKQTTLRLLNTLRANEKQNIHLATSYKELDVMAKKLTKSNGLLTDAELELLEANEAYLEEKLEDERDSVKELLDLKKDILNKEKDALNDYLKSVTTDIKTLEDAVKSIDGVLDKLNGSIYGTDYSLDSYYNSMSKTMALSANDDYKAYSDSLKDTIKKSEILFNADAFATDNDQKFAQMVAANQFNALQNSNFKEIDYLKQIETNTKLQVVAIVNTIDALSIDLNEASEQQLNKLGNILSTIDSGNASNVEALNAVTTAINGLDLSAKKVVPPKNTYTLAEANAAISSGTVTAREVSVPITNNYIAPLSVSAKDQAVYDAFASVLNETPTAADVKYWSNNMDTAHMEEAVRTAAIENGEIKGYATGGYTGNYGVNEIAGVVHGQEYVVNAQTTKDLGLNNSGGVLREMLNEMKAMREELKQMKQQNHILQTKLIQNTQASRLAV